MSGFSGPIASMGSAIVGGVTGYIPFVGPNATFAEDPFLVWDNVMKEITIGGPNNWTGQLNTPMNLTSNVNNYAQVNFQNKSNGPLASTDFICEADNDGIGLVGHYADIGINSSGYFSPVFTWAGPNDGYFYTSGGNTLIGTDTLGKNISFATGGTTPSNIRMTVGDTGVTINVPLIVSSFQLATLSLTGKTTKYNNVNTVGWGSPAIYGYGRSLAAVAAVSSVAAYTVGAVDGSFTISANVNVTTFAVGTFNVTVAYTDETNTGQTLKLTFSSVTGTLGVAVAAAGAFEGLIAHIRCKAGTTITVATSGTFTSLIYNVEAAIAQIA